MEFLFDEELLEVFSLQRDYISYLKNPLKILDDALKIEIDYAMTNYDEILEEMMRRKIISQNERRKLIGN